ncbi:MAG: S41 family peptidase [Pseudonocardia sp.]
MTPSYLRHPHLHGDSVVFVAEDDVWLAPLDGGRAYRLSADRVPVADPRLSPDGSKVAWTSWAAGAPEVYVADLEGGGARRLTYWGDFGTHTLGWTSDGEVLAATASGRQYYRRTLAHAVGLDSGPGRVLPYGPLSELVALPGGGAALLSAVMMREPAWWKRYRGGTAGKLWCDAAGTGEFTRLLGEVDGQLSSLMVVRAAGAKSRRKPRLAFLSDHEGWGNVYSATLSGGDLRRHTDHGSADGALPAFYARHASTDGVRVIYQCAGELWLLDTLDAQARRLDIRLGGPRTARTPYRLQAGYHLGSTVPDETGRTSVVQLRGTVHRLTHRDGPARTLAAQPGVRARLARPLGADRVVWVDDASGEDTVVIAPLDSTAQDDGGRRRLGDGEIGRVLELACAPDGSRVALAAHDGRLLVLDTGGAGGTGASGGEIRQLARGVDGEVSGLAFSPDGAWLAWSDPVEADARRIMLARLADDELVEVTEPRFVDTEPVFTLDGKYLAFLSRRSFDPVYDAHSFDLSFPFGCRPYLVPLAARTPSPFGASPDGRPVNGDDDDQDERHFRAIGLNERSVRSRSGGADAAGGGGKDGDSAEDSDAPEPVVVDVDGLQGRVVPVPVDEAHYHRLAAGKDCLLWVCRPMAGALGDGLAKQGRDRPRPALERFDLSRRRHDVIAEPVSAYHPSGDGTRLVVRDGDTLRVLRTDRSGSGPPGDSDADEFEIDTDRLSVTVDPTAEWRQMYDEAGRLMRDLFWVADMAGVDWEGELARYRPLVDAVGSRDDLVDLLWEVNGELGTSHAYIRAGKGGDWSERPGLLGADLERDADGRWRIARVLPGESSDPRAASPLTAPGVDVRAGDVVLEVGGRPVDPVAGPAPLLVGTAGEPVELTVRTAASDGDGEVRRVVVFPLADDGQLRYQDWVAGRRAFVAQRSGGRLGYLHLPDMGANGWAQVHRDLRRETAREGLIVDVRENGGGHISQLVVEKLARKVIGWDVVRHGQPESYPAEAPRGPVVGVTDEFAASDGDIVTAAFQRMGIGPVVGVRTWGGVIGIDSRYRLVDGTKVTQPRYATWFDHSGWEIENYGVDPDVEVVMAPQDWVAGRDPQLAAAVDLALETLTQRPAAMPPDPSTRPSRARIPLPPR